MEYARMIERRGGKIHKIFEKFVEINAIRKNKTGFEKTNKVLKKPKFKETRFQETRAY